MLPFFGKKALSEITPGLVQDYRIHRSSSRKDPRPGLPLKPSRSSLHKEIVTLRQVLKCANRHGWHLANPLNAAAINVRAAKPKRERQPAGRNTKKSK